MAANLLKQVECLCRFQRKEVSWKTIKTPLYVITDHAVYKHSPQNTTNIDQINMDLIDWLKYNS